MAKILVVEDDRILRELVTSYLSAGDHVVDTADCGETALALLEVVTEYDLIILDWMMPGVSGLEVCRQYRNNRGQAPILFLTSRSDKLDKATGLDAGADDYLVKPFEQIEFQARVRALLRRTGQWQGKLMKVDGLEIDSERQIASLNGIELNLRPKEFALLELLMKYPGRSFTADSLYRKLWSSDSDTSVETVRMHVMSLRKKIDRPGHAQLITSSRGRGYKIEPLQV